jgi:membrane fusion protein (multidrug efflux system)
MNRHAWLITGAFFLWVSGCKQKEKEKDDDPENYSVTSPLKTDTTFNKDYVAQIQSFRNVEIRAQEKGYLQQIHVDEGRFVRAGQELFTIMPKLFEADVQKQEANVKQAEVDLANTKILADKNIVAPSELKMAQAKLDEAKADLSAAELHLSFTRIRAPFDGIIDRLPFKQGSLIDEGTLLTTLSDNRSMYAYFNVSEDEYLNYKAGTGNNQQSSVSLLLANGEPFQYKGTVETVEGQFDNTTGTIAFRAKFPNPGGLLRNGQTGKLQMTIPVKNALIIPQKATYDIQDKTYVFVVDAGNKVRSKAITIRYSLPEIYVVDSGLNEGDKILLDGVQNVKEGDQIEYKFIAPAAALAGLQLIKQ